MFGAGSPHFRVYSTSSVALLGLTGRRARQAGVQQRPMRQAGADMFGGARRLLGRASSIDSGSSTWGLVGQGRKPEAQAQRPVQPVRAHKPQA